MGQGTAAGTVTGRANLSARRNHLILITATPIWKKEIMHGEVGARKCCWYGDWKKKSKCEKKPSHRDNCYSNILKKEVMHGEMGARKCCWYGDWKRKSKCNGGHKDD